MQFEFEILDFLQKIRTPFGDWFMQAVSKLGDAGMLWIVLTLVLLCIPKTRKTGIHVGIALVINLIVCNLVLKPVFGRIRPYNVNKTIMLLVKPLKDFSFPSGHTSASFTAVSALYFAGEKKMAKCFLIPAVFIAFSRMYLYVHYPTDILGGLVVGILSGYLADIILKRKKR